MCVCVCVYLCVSVCVCVNTQIYRSIYILFLLYSLIHRKKNINTDSDIYLGFIYTFL